MKRIIYFILPFIALAISSSGQKSSQTSTSTPVAERTEVEITSLLKSPEQADECLVTLTAKNDTSLKLVMRVGMHEAQTLVITIEKMHSTAALPLDVLETAITKFGYTVKEVSILDLVDAIYTARIRCTTDGKVVDLTARAVDATTMALKFNAPIFVRTDLMRR